MSPTIHRAPQRRKTFTRIARGTFAAVLLMGGGSFLAAHAASAHTTADVRVSTTSDRSASTALDGGMVKGNAYISLNATGVKSASFWLDNPAMSTTPRRTDSAAPFDFVGSNADGTAQPLNTALVADGSHTVTVRVTHTDGTADTVTSTFTVANLPSGTNTIFGATTPPNASANDTLAVELGVKFRVTQAMNATGVRFYKGALNTGTHTGSLWTSTGTRLATVTFTGETAAGWQNMRFATPVALKANTTYIVSMFAPKGGYAYASSAFASAGAGVAPVQALKSGVDGPNGVYRYGSTSAFPTASYNATNYFVDVMVSGSTATTTTTQPPTTTTAPPTATTQPPTTTTAPPTTTTQPPSTGFVVRNATNTGVPAGTVLQASGGLNITVDNTVISGLDIQGCVTVNAKNVTIKNSKISCNGYYPVRADAGYNTLIQDVTIDGLASDVPTAVYGDNYTVLRANIYGVGDGPRAGSNVTIQDSYIHDLHVANGSHNDGIQSTGGSNIVIRGNNIQHPNQGNATLMLTPTFGPLSNVLIENNLLNGGSFTVHAGGDPNEAATTNVVFRNNRFGRNYIYGIKAFGVGDITWTNNVWNDTGVVIP